MKFRYYITDMLECTVCGTDSDEDAEFLSASDEHFIVDTSTGEWLTSNGARQKIEQLEYSDD
jgi:hypothetical protein